MSSALVRIKLSGAESDTFGWQLAGVFARVFGYNWHVSSITRTEYDVQTRVPGEESDLHPTAH